jgi:hypothetical protein
MLDGIRTHSVHLQHAHHGNGLIITARSRKVADFSDKNSLQSKALAHFSQFDHCEKWGNVCQEALKG